MIIKSSNLLYLFDFDGTLTGTDVWGGYLSNAKKCFQTLHFNPAKLDIRWSILTSRPKIDRPLVGAVCTYHNLTPQVIMMGPTFTWKFKNETEIATYKSNVVKSILDDKSPHFTKIEKVIYIDNDPTITVPMNSMRKDYRYIAISVADMLTKNLHEVIL